MALPSSQPRYEAALTQAVTASDVDSNSTMEPETPVAAPPSSPTPRTPGTLRNPANRVWAQKTQRDLFIQHLRNWASNHDSSPYFHGSISLHPQGTLPGEVVALGKSVNCILTDTSSEGITKNVVVRLFKSGRQDGNACRQRVYGGNDSAAALGTASWNTTDDVGSHREKPQTQQRQSVAPYHLVVRSGSGWVTARQYFDKHHFAHPQKPDPPKAPPGPAWANLTEDIPPPLWANSTFPTTPTPGAFLPLSPNNVNWSINTNNQAREPSAPTKQRDQNSLLLIHSKQNRLAPAAKDTVTISPLFRPFLRLPQELQDEILFQAVGYTRRISLTHTLQVKNATRYLEAPISISKLFQISKAINQKMVPHIFSTTNFHFGMTGFTKFLWQLGPVNRSNLKHVTFHFGKQSLLHCIRWTAPDPVYEMLEPPVATHPTTLTYFWRCQLQDLMKELNLLTLTIDIGDVPLSDVPMLIRILSIAVGSVERIRVISNHGGTGMVIEENVQDLPTRFTDTSKTTWRELCQRYHSDYKHYRWHMRQLWANHDVDTRVQLDAWMDKDKIFFDS